MLISLTYLTQSIHLNHQTTDVHQTDSLSKEICGEAGPVPSCLLHKTLLQYEGERRLETSLKCTMIQSFHVMFPHPSLGPSILQHPMWQDDLTGAAKAVNTCLSKVYSSVGPSIWGQISDHYGVNQGDMTCSDVL